MTDDIQKHLDRLDDLSFDWQAARDELSRIDREIEEACNECRRKFDTPDIGALDRIDWLHAVRDDLESRLEEEDG